MGTARALSWTLAAAALGLAPPALAQPASAPAPADSRGERASPGSDDGGATPSDISGPPLAPREPRPDGAERWAVGCSPRLPLCVHADPRAPDAVARAVLAAAERAWALLTGALDFPAPDADVPDAGRGAYRLYVTPNAAEPARTFLAERDPRAAFDRASAFTVVDAKQPLGCALDARVFREVARAALFRAAPATTEALARAQTDYLARLVSPCVAGDPTDIARHQARPHVPLTEADPPAGGSLFFWYLDATYAREPGGLVRALWALSPTMTPWPSVRWNDDPDAFDVLGMTFRGAAGVFSTIDDLFVDYAIARAFVGAGDDGRHLPEARGLGEPARVALDRDVPWPASPRRFSSPEGIAPTGAVYVRVSLKGAPAGARLRVEAEWEELARLKWTVVKLDAAGRSLAELRITSKDRGTQAALTVADLEGASALLIVGANVGEWLAPLDPDAPHWEPHGWMLTVSPE